MFSFEDHSWFSGIVIFVNVIIKIIYEITSILSWKWYYGKCGSKRRLDGKTVIITGANSGIGKETTLDLYKRGANIIMACRNASKTASAILEIKNRASNESKVGKLRFMHLDLNSLASVKKFAKDVLKNETKIGILINNAGVMMSPLKFTEDGFEEQFSSNYVGHFLLTLMLLPLIIKTRNSRIVVLSSLAHYIGHYLNENDLKNLDSSHGVVSIYCQSKLACLLFAKELARKLENNNIDSVKVYAVHPGVIRTNLGRHLSNTIMSGATYLWNSLGFYLLKNPTSGARTTIHCAVDENCENENGFYYCECAPAKPSVEALDPQKAERLWNATCKQIGIPKNFNPFSAANINYFT